MNTRRTSIALAAVAVFCVSVAGAATKPNPHADLDCNYCHFDTPRFGVDTRETVDSGAPKATAAAVRALSRAGGNVHPLGVTPGPEHLGTRVPKHLPLGKSEAVRGQVVCTTCHFLHAADADRALLRGFPG